MLISVSPLVVDGVQAWFGGGEGVENPGKE